MPVPSEFFSTTAQVLPVMAITLIVEQRVFLPANAQARDVAEQSSSSGALFAVLSGLLATVIGEVFALSALIWGGETLHLAAVLATLVWLSIVVVLPVLHRLIRDPSARAGGRKLARFAMAALSLLGTIVAGLVPLVLWIVHR